MTLMGTMAELARSGFVEHFGVRGDELQSFDSGRTFAADQVVIREYHRFEGVSDPDDMAVVYALESREGTKGVLTDAYGVYSDPAVGAMLDVLRIDPVREGRAGPARAGAA